MDQQQTSGLPTASPVLGNTVGVLPAGDVVPVQNNILEPIKEESSSANWLLWLGLVGGTVVILLLVYFLYIKGRVGNSIVISPQEFTRQISISEIMMKKSGFFVMFIGDDFNVPKYAFYSSPLLPVGIYKDIVVETAEDTYLGLVSTYKPTTKLFAYLFEDTNKNGLYDHENGAAQGLGPDKPIKDLAGKAVFVEVSRP